MRALSHRTSSSLVLSASRPRSLPAETPSLVPADKPGGASWPRLFVCLTLLLLAFVYLYEINHFPVYDYDETGFLNIPYRFATFGDAKYPAVFSDSYNSEASRKYPPPLAFWLRNLFHYTAGFSAQSSRIFSAALIFSVVLAAVVFLLARLGASFWLILTTLAAIGFHPSILSAARSVRMEQEVFFLGMMGVLGVPLLIHSVRGGRSFLWTISGILAGWAACSHPWGAVFPAVLLLSFLAYRRSWAETDALALRRRLAFWMAGVALPGILTLSAFLSDWQQYRRLHQEMADYYAIRDVQNTQSMAQALPALSRYLPLRFVAHLRELQWTAFFNWTEYKYRFVFEILFFIQIIGIAIYAGLSFFSRPAGAHVLIRVAVWLALGFLAFLFYYIPSENYYLYPAFTIPLAFALMTFQLWQQRCSHNHFLRRGLAAICLLVLVAEAVATAHFTRYQVRWITAKVGERSLNSLDSRFDAVAAMAKRLSWHEEKRPIYGDMITWIAGGRNQKSLFEKTGLVPGAMPTDVGGIAFQMRLLEACIDLPNLGPKQLTAEGKIERIGAMVRPTALAGVIFDRETEFYFHAPFDRAPQTLHIARFLSNNQLTWTTIDSLVAPSSPLWEKNSWTWRCVPQGSYLLLLSDNTLVGKKLCLTIDDCVGQGKQHSRHEFYLGPLNRHVPKAVLVEVPKNDALIRLQIHDADIPPLLDQEPALFRLKPSDM